ncbi:hypothetical protein ACGFZP_13230 [Kitasatospora sp. NPDC048239]|uniref:hypothetical protein n=1 Tax=Kitasatospora sp. NPDC048239 TaxID=3364046 RepID=UPI00371C81EA
MTSPTDLARLIQDQQIGEARNLEEATVRQAVGNADDLLVEALRLTLTEWIGEFGSATSSGDGDALTRILAAVGERIRTALAGLGARARRAAGSSLPHAVALGAKHARQLVRAAGQRVSSTAGSGARLPRALTDQARGIGDAVSEQLRRAKQLLAANPERFSSLATVLQVARSAVSRVRALLAWLVHTAVNAGTAAVADGMSVGRLWVSEQDACLRCTAYSGRTIRPGGEFPGGLSFDPQQRAAEAPPVSGPPLHPHCRCRAVPWSASWGTGLPNLLRHQAERAVAEGWALPSESGVARVRAARALLNSGVSLPPRVAERAHRAVRTGRFDRAA